jgi:hypothetical protein
MTKTKAKKTKSAELDNIYLLKIVLYLVLGSFWLRISTSNGSSQIPIPVGFIAGIILASHEKLRIDRKLEYAILLVAMFIGFWLSIGITYVR